MNCITILILIVTLLISVMQKYVSSGINYSGGNSSSNQYMPLITRYDQLTERKQFVHKTKAPITVHNGQLKLFLTELQFMTSCLDAYNSAATFIYAGSAPCNKLSYLMKMFPAAKFVLIDPNEHYIQFGRLDQYDEPYRNDIMYFQLGAEKGAGPGYTMRKSATRGRKLSVMSIDDDLVRGDNIVGTVPDDIAEIIATANCRVFVIENLFDERLAALLKPLCAASNGYFISDIRTYEISENSELDILWNSALMYNWLAVLEPAKYMLKFRCPWPGANVSNVPDYMKPAFDACPIKFIDNHVAGRFEFLDGTIMIQAFPGQKSTETRLISSGLKTIIYDPLEYEEKLFHYNMNIRPYPCATMSHIKKNKLCIDKCMDCAIMYELFNNYGQKYNIAINPFNEAKTLLNMLDRNICVGGHGSIL